MPPPESLSLAALRALEQNPDLTQRQLARELGVSLGRTNYCVRALVGRGLVNAGNFRRSDNKRAYLYKLTPAGIAEKARLAARFLRAKEEEHQAFLAEIEQLRAEVAAHGYQVTETRSFR